jgi:membrane-bound acyltransferase YfiQ involved in biofilm formation
VSGAQAADGADFANRKLPPVAEIAVVSMALVIVGGIFMAAHLPAHPPLGFAEVLLVLAAVVLVTNVVLLARLRDFAWASFFLVAKWSLLAYLVIAGMLEYIFVFDGTRGQILVVMTCMLAIFAVNVPMLLAFSVARYQPVT